MVNFQDYLKVGQTSPWPPSHKGLYLYPLFLVPTDSTSAPHSPPFWLQFQDTLVLKWLSMWKVYKSLLQNKINYIPWFIQTLFCYIKKSEDGEERLVFLGVKLQMCIGPMLVFCVIPVLDKRAKPPATDSSYSIASKNEDRCRGTGDVLAATWINLQLELLSSTLWMWTVWQIQVDCNAFWANTYNKKLPKSFSISILQQLWSVNII